MERVAEVSARLERGIRERVFPGCVCVLVDGDAREEIALGHFMYDAHSPRVNAHTRYDVASVTKVMASMLLLSQLVDEGVVGLETKLSQVLPDFANSPFRADVSVLHLLTYTVPFAAAHSKELRQGKTPEEFGTALRARDLVAWPGSAYCYSNVTAYWATLLVEHIAKKTLPELFYEKIARPLGLATATWSIDPSERYTIPPTEVTEVRGEVRGIVHDESSEYLAHAGHAMGAAGLFASAGDSATFLAMALCGGVSKDGVRIVSDEMVARWVQDQLPSIATPTPCMWSDDQNVRAQKLGPQVIHKGGFTGCMMLGDMTTRKGFVLLSNRTYPTRPKDSRAFVSVWEEVARLVLL